MAAANAVLDVMLEDGFLDHVTSMGEKLTAQVADVAARHPAVLSGVRGLGLMLGIECVAPNRDLMAKLRNNGLLTVAAGDNVLRLLPPLIIEESHIDEAVAILDATCGEWSSADD